MGGLKALGIYLLGLLFLKAVDVAITTHYLNERAKMWSKVGQSFAEGMDKVNN